MTQIVATKTASRWLDVRGEELPIKRADFLAHVSLGEVFNKSNVCRVSHALPQWPVCRETPHRQRRGIGLPGRHQQALNPLADNLSATWNVSCDDGPPSGSRLDQRPRQSFAIGQ